MTNEALLLIGGAMLGALVGLPVVLLVQPLLEEPAERLLVYVFGSRAPSTAQSIAGKWECRWWKDDGAMKPPREITLRKLRNSITGTFDFEESTYNLRGKIENNTIVTGTYYDKVRGRTFHGAFQLHIQPRVQTMTGRWIGFNRHNQIKSGPWEWRRSAETSWPSEMKDEASAGAGERER